MLAHLYASRFKASDAARARAQPATCDPPISRAVRKVPVARTAAPAIANDKRMFPPYWAAIVASMAPTIDSAKVAQRTRSSIVLSEFAVADQTACR